MELYTINNIDDRIGKVINKGSAVWHSNKGDSRHHKTQTAQEQSLQYTKLHKL